MSILGVRTTSSEVTHRLPHRSARSINTYFYTLVATHPPPSNCKNELRSLIVNDMEDSIRIDKYLMIPHADDSGIVLILRLKVACINGTAFLTIDRGGGTVDHEWDSIAPHCCGVDSCYDIEDDLPTNIADVAVSGKYYTAVKLDTNGDPCDDKHGHIHIRDAYVFKGILHGLESTEPIRMAIKCKCIVCDRHVNDICICGHTLVIPADFRVQKYIWRTFYFIRRDSLPST